MKYFTLEVCLLPVNSFLWWENEHIMSIWVMEFQDRGYKISDIFGIRMKSKSLFSKIGPKICQLTIISFLEVSKNEKETLASFKGVGMKS
jgi:hypothetical protein